MKISSNVGGGAQGAAAKNGAAGKNASAGKNADDMDVKVFSNPEFGSVRTKRDENGEPLFCGQDVCKALGYKRAYDAIRQHVNPSDTAKRSIARIVKNRYGQSSKTQKVAMLFVNESGVYSLVFGSKLESAQRFKHWVTSEVLPAIRKNGGYFHINPNETPEQIKARFQKVLEKALAERDEEIKRKEYMLQSTKLLLSLNKKLVAEQTDRIRQLDKTVGDQVVKLQKSAENIEALEKDVDRMQPKELYVDNVLDSISCYTTTQIAKELGITAQELNRSLCACHIQYYQSGQYMLYAEYAHMGLAKSRTKSGVKTLDLQVPIGDAERSMKLGQVYTRTYLVWTERGRKFIHDLAKRMWDLAEYERLKFKVKVKCFNKVC